MPDTLAQKIKAKYPGQYDDIPDAELETRVKAKYPGVYDDIPTSGPQQPTLAEMMANVPTDEAGRPLTQPSQLRQSLESVAYPQSASDLVSLAIPGAPEVAGAVRSGIRSLPTLIGAGIGYAHSGVPGAIYGAMEGGVAGMVARAVRGGLEGAREAAAASPVSQVLQAMKDAETTIQAQFFKPAVNRVALGEDAAKVVKEYSGKTAATTAEIKAGQAPAAATPSLPAHLTPKDVIPLPDSVPRLQTVVEGLPQIAPPPPPNVAPPIAPASIPAAWKPYAGQTELGQVLPAQPPGRTMSGATQASRPFVPPATRPSQSPAGAVNMAMKDTGLRIPARVMDAAIRRVKAGEDAVDVVKSYAEAK